MRTRVGGIGAEGWMDNEEAETMSTAIWKPLFLLGV